jgi:hypothetical protein
VQRRPQAGRNRLVQGLPDQRMPENEQRTGLQTNLEST